MRPLFTLVFISLLATVSSVAQSTNGLIAHWKLTGNANDSSGFNRHGSIQGSVTPDTGKLGKPGTAMNFKNGGYILVPYNAAWNLTRFSIATVMKADSINIGWCQGNTIVCRNGGPVGEWMLNFHDNHSDNDVPGFCNLYDVTKYNFEALAAGGPGGQPVYSPGVAINTWYTVVATYDSANIKIYIDGTLVKTSPRSVFIGTSTNDVTIGINGTEFPLIGSIDDLRIYNRALSDSEVVVYHNTGADTGTLSVGSPAMDLASVSLFPNPAGHELSVRIDGVNAHTQKHVAIIDQFGRTVGTYSFSTREATLPVSHLADGMYYLRVSVGDETVTRRFVKSR